MYSKALRYFNISVTVTIISQLLRTQNNHKTCCQKFLFVSVSIHWLFFVLDMSVVVMGALSDELDMRVLCHANSGRSENVF